MKSLNKIFTIVLLLSIATCRQVTDFQVKKITGEDDLPEKIRTQES